MQKVISVIVDLPNMSTLGFQTELRGYIERDLDVRVSDTFDGVDTREPDGPVRSISTAASGIDRR